MPSTSVWTELVRSLRDPGGLRARGAAVAFATALVSGACAAAIAALTGIGIGAVILAVMLSISLTERRLGRSARERWAALVAVPVVALLAGGVAWLLLSAWWAGAAVFVLVISGGIWIRRFGPPWQRIGTLATLPLITVLVVPVPPGQGGGFALWAPVIALITLLWAIALQWLARRIGLVAPAGGTRAAALSPVLSPARSTGGAGAPARAPGRTAGRLSAHARLAIQMAAGLALAFLLGRLLFGDHWPWVVITAFIVASGNRGRGDVLYKGVHRTVGGLGGTALAALLALVALLAGTGRPDASGSALIVASIAVILAIGLWLRPSGYGWWAAAMTAMLSLVSELTGVAPLPALLARLLAILLGGVIATAIAWFVLPVRTGDVLRRRTTDALAAIAELLASCVKDPAGIPEARRRLADETERLVQLAPTLRAERLSRRVPAGSSHRSEIIPAVRALADTMDAISSGIRAESPLSAAAQRDLAAVAQRLGAMRLVLRGTVPEPAPELAPDALPAMRELADAVEALRGPLSALGRRPSPASPAA